MAKQIINEGSLNTPARSRGKQDDKDKDKFNKKDNKAKDKRQK